MLCLVLIQYYSYNITLLITNIMFTSSLFSNLIFHQKICRNRNKDVAKRTQVHLEHEKLLFNTVIKDLANSNSKSFHSLIELSTTQWKRYADNCICVSGIKEHKLTKCNTLLKLVYGISYVVYCTMYDMMYYDYYVYII